MSTDTLIKDAATDRRSPGGTKARFVRPLRRASRFGYDAVESDGRRRPPRSDTRSEDKILPSSKRKKMVGTARDVIRNYCTAAWMVRCHLDYVSKFSFQSRTGDDALDEAIERLICEASLPGNFEVSGRFDRNMGTRISEARRVLDGDIFWGKLSSGRVQLIEGDRVRNHGTLPSPWTSADFCEGIATTAGGRLRAVLVCKRAASGYEFERIIPARHVWQHAYWDTTYRVDQVRGITPIAPALNTLQDVYEGMSLAMAKAKVAQMFGLVFYRQAVEEQEGWAENRTATNDADGDGLDDETGETAEDGDRYEVDPGKGPFKLELDAGERAEFLSTNTPESELLAFLQFSTDLALKSLDIPYSFYDATKVNYYGRKADIQQYENSAATKRGSNQQLLRAWAKWRLRSFILSGRLELPGAMILADVESEWVPCGMPWVDKLRDMKADQLALNSNLDSEVRIARRSGQDAREIARERMDFEKWLAGEREARELPPLQTAGTKVGITDTDKGDDNA